MERQNDGRCRHNEAKYKILSILVLCAPKRYLLPREIAQLTGLSKLGVRKRLSKMHFQGYIWRRKAIWKGENGYMYRYLKPMGHRVLNGLEMRMRIREITGVNISLNRKKPVPTEVLAQYRRAISL